MENGSHIKDLITAIENNLDKPSQHIDICHGVVHKAIHFISHIVEQSVQSLQLPLRYCVTKIIEGDDEMFDQLHIDQGDRHIIEHILQKMEEEAGTDREAALVDMRYSFIEDVCQHTVFIERKNRQYICATAQVYIRGGIRFYHRLRAAVPANRILAPALHPFRHHFFRCRIVCQLYRQHYMGIRP